MLTITTIKNWFKSYWDYTCKIEFLKDDHIRLRLKINYNLTNKQRETILNTVKASLGI